MLELVFKYRGCVLRCRPVVLASGGYGAHVLIVGNSDRPALVKHVPDLGYFHTPESALEQSKVWAMNWVDDELHSEPRAA